MMMVMIVIAIGEVVVVGGRGGAILLKGSVMKENNVKHLD